MYSYGLRLAGWDNLSTWGYDASVRSLYAQLTRNGNSDDDGPDVWITPPTFPVVLVPTALAVYIAAATGSEKPAVYAAMNAGLDGHTDAMARAYRSVLAEHMISSTLQDRLWAELTDAQAAGLACVICGLDYRHNSARHIPVGRSATGSEVFACADSPQFSKTLTCAERASGGAIPVDQDR